MAASDRQQSLPGFEPQSDPPVAADGSGPITESCKPVSQATGEPPENLAGRTVWVVDANSLIHQVFHALPEMTSPQGEPVGAVFGFARDMLYLLQQKKPDFLFCAFDLPGKTFRHAMYDQYKARRPKMHEDLAAQFPVIYRLVEALGIPALSYESYEADDVLATVARVASERGGLCFLVTGDKDCRQLISDQVQVYNIRKDEMFDREALRADWGISPQQVVDYQALVGDSVDNVPGVPLIGPKLARQLLEQYSTLEAILDHTHEVAGAKRQENLRNYRQQALMSRELARLNGQVPVAIDWEAGRTGRINRTAARQLFRELGFRNLGETLDALERGVGVISAPSDTVAPLFPNGESEEAPPTVSSAFVYHLVDTAEGLAAFVDQLRRQKRISLDTETTSVRPRWAELVGLSFAWNDQEGWYLPVRAPEGERHLDERATLEALRPILEDPAVEKMGQNLKYDMIVLRSAGIELAGVAFDTMVASYLLDAGQRNHNLDDLAQTYLNHTTTKITELIGTGKSQKRMDQVPVRQVADYAGEDALLPVRLCPLLAQRLAAASLTDLCTQVELPLIDVLVEMEYNGIKVDVARLGELSRRFGERIAALEQEIYDLIGRPINIGSPKQLQEVLFNELKLPVVKKTAKTGPSTDADVLEELARVHPLPAKIVEYRQYAKLKSTYVDALPQMVHPTTGRVHTSLNQVVTATGRLSSNDPNLQNIPIRGEEGREIRSAFVPGEAGWILLAADYSQIELRVLAHYSGDEQLCAAFARDEDIHAQVASEVNHVPLAEVTRHMRREAKAVNFGVIYGQSAYGLARNLGIDEKVAAQFIDRYFAGYPGIERFLRQILAECYKKGYVSTILGRRRAIRGVRADTGRQRNLAERTAVNTVIQGSAADLMKLAMIAVHRRLQREKLGSRMLLQIHDELVFEVPPDELLYLAQLVSEEMAGVRKLSVPLKVDVKAGPNWAEAEGVGVRD
jgi:DNA polymerase I